MPEEEGSPTTEKKEQKSLPQDDRVLQAENNSVDDGQRMRDYEVRTETEDKENTEKIVLLVKPELDDKRHELISSVDQKPEADESESNIDDDISRDDITRRRHNRACWYQTSQMSLINRYERKVSAYLVVAFILIVTIVSVCVSMLPQHLRVMIFIIVISVAALVLLYLRSYFIDNKDF